MIFSKGKPKKDDKYHWTNHALQKMAFYRLSESRIKKILRNPQRTEEGVALNTIASMQRNDGKKRKEEIWMMFQKKSEKLKRKKFTNGKIIIISAWRYPGVSSIGKKIPIPDNILEELKESGFIERIFIRE